MSVRARLWVVGALLATAGAGLACPPPPPWLWYDRHDERAERHRDRWEYDHDRWGGHDERHDHDRRERR
jgi:hypothetical protein